MDGTADAAWPAPVPAAPSPPPLPPPVAPAPPVAPPEPAPEPVPAPGPRTVPDASVGGGQAAAPAPELGVASSWRYAFALGWALVLMALARLFLSARQLELTPRWDSWWPVPFLLGVLVLAAGVLDRGAFAASVAGTVVLGFMAGLDLQGGRTGLGRYEAALTLSAAILTLVVRAAPLTEVPSEHDGSS
jgi:hypothetical protein